MGIYWGIKMNQELQNIELIEKIKTKLEDAETVISKVWSKGNTRGHVHHPDSTGAERCAINYWNEYYPTGFRKFTFHGAGKANGSTAIVLSNDADKALTIANHANHQENLTGNMKLESEETTTLSGQCTLIYYDNGDY